MPVIIDREVDLGIDCRTRRKWSLITSIELLFGAKETFACRAHRCRSRPWRCLVLVVGCGWVVPGGVLGMECSRSW